MAGLKPLPPEALYRRCEVEELNFETTDELEAHYDARNTPRGPIDQVREHLAELATEASQIPR